jgi:penicillin-binding protein 1B
MPRKIIPYFKPEMIKSNWKLITTLVMLVFLFPTCLYVLYLDQVIIEKFEGKRWELPARVYARPLELYAGKHLSPSQLQEELIRLDFKASPDARQPGTYKRVGKVLYISTRPFEFWDNNEPSKQIQVSFSNDYIDKVVNRITLESEAIVRFDPLLIGSIYPSHNEDRILLQIDEVPERLINTLIAVEDRAFRDHHGVQWRAIFRALLVNLRSGRVVQGGSTITQQLVKNFYLSNERTLWRKLNEAIMAMLLDWHYDKDEILEAYCNEIYLGQDGKRAIHGFALASQFYFQRPLNELSVSEIALLVGLVKGPSYYDPRRQQDRAIQRRNSVLEILESVGLIGKEEAILDKQSSLGVIEKRPSGITPYPAFIDLVRRQLRRDYRPEDLSTEGLRIFTSLNPLVQTAAEHAVQQWIPQLEQNKELPEGSLETGLIVSSVGNAEVAAVVGGRNVRYSGYNRALDTERHIGSLVKPAVYLTALEDKENYTLSTLVTDEPVNLAMDNGELWSPQNFDHTSHGQVPLIMALANSYNQATVNLGMSIGLESVASTIQRLGIEGEFNTYPSLLLGAITLSPLEVAQMYQTLSDGGFYTPLRSIRAVTTTNNILLQRYPLKTEQRFDPVAAYFTTSAMATAIRKGTGRVVYEHSLQPMALAGKTGTTDDLRDSWYAGFGGDYLGVVWLGSDNNVSIGLTGASGALKIWASLMKEVEGTGLEMIAPQGVESVIIDPVTGLRTRDTCASGIVVPFLENKVPADYAPCSSTK